MQLSRQHLVFPAATGLPFDHAQDPCHKHDINLQKIPSSLLSYFKDPNSMVYSDLEKLTVAQLLNKFPAFYGTLSFITLFTTTCHWTLS